MILSLTIDTKVMVTSVADTSVLIWRVWFESSKNSEVALGVRVTVLD
jgi:hypothetical protein